jgi:hypothetical protein
MIGKFDKVDDNCILYLTDKKKSSSIWSDLSKSNIDGSVNNAILARNGYTFDGETTTKISIPHNSVLNLTDAITFNIWMKLNYYDVLTYPYLIDKVASGIHTIVLNYPSNDAIGWGGYFGGVQKWVTLPLSMLDYTWHLIGFTGEPTVIKSYLDGVYQSETVITAPMDTSNNDLHIGSGSYDGDTGRILISNRTWSSNEMLNFFGKTRKFYGV